MLELCIHMLIHTVRFIPSNPHFEILTTLTIREDINAFITVYGKEPRYTVHRVKRVHVCFTALSCLYVFLN